MKCCDLTWTLRLPMQSDWTSNMCDVLDKVENRGIEKGIVKGESRGENKMALLVKKLLDQNRIDDVKRASEDEKSRAELMKELGIN